MENASKALIIAGAILISILLISVGILVYNSTKGVTENVGDADYTMEIAAARKNVQIILETNDFKDENKFEEYIDSKYIGKTLTSVQAIELGMLIVQRSEKITGSGYDNNIIHLTKAWGIMQPSGLKYVVSYEENNPWKIKYELKKDGRYRAGWTDKSIRIVEE